MMNKYILAALVLIGIVSIIGISGCTIGPDNNLINNTNTTGNNTGNVSTNASDTVTIEFQTYGGFTPVTHVRQQLIITQDKALYTVYAGDGSITQRYEKPIDRQAFDDLVETYEDNDFMELDENQTISQPLVADAGAANITYTRNGVSKTIMMDPYAPEFYEDDIRQIFEETQQFLNDVTLTTENDARRIAEDFIKSSPTFRYDGTDLEFVDYIVRESFPEQHVVRYNFTSSHAGYGNRSDEIVAQRITEHTMVVRVVNNEVESAIIDNVWDELNQRMLSAEKITVEYQPMQCETESWNAWINDSDIRFIQAPTEEQVAALYFSEVYGINIEGFEKVTVSDSACLACDVCAKTYKYTMNISEADAAMLEREGWRVAD